MRRARGGDGGGEAGVGLVSQDVEVGWIMEGGASSAPGRAGRTDAPVRNGDSCASSPDYWLDGSGLAGSGRASVKFT